MKITLRAFSVFCVFFFLSAKAAQPQAGNSQPAASPEFSLLTIADQPKVLEEFTSDFSEIQNRLAFAHAKGSTTLYDAVYLGLEKMKHGHNPKKAILLITDGEDTRSRYLLNVRNAVKESDTQIYAIGIVDSYYSAFSQEHTGRAVLESPVERLISRTQCMNLKTFV
ncbi:MAG: VWA domain-containing protein [Terriglobia bacterium]